MMYETARETPLKPENNAESLITKIILVLKENNLSLSQTRALFHEIIIRLEDAPLN